MSMPHVEDPVWSRNYGDEASALQASGDIHADEEEDVAPLPPPPAPLSLFRPSFRPEATRLLVVALHECAAVAVRAACPDAALREVGTVMLPDAPPSAVGHASPLDAVRDGAASCVVCEVEGREGVVVVLAQQHVPEARAFGWARALLDALPATGQTVVLDSLVAGAYQAAGSGGAAAPLLRRVDTSKATGDGACPPLEQPNMARAAAAALVAECEAAGRDARLYLSLLCPREERECASAFAPALADAGLGGAQADDAGAVAKMLARVARGVAERPRSLMAMAGHDGLAEAGRSALPAHLFM